MVAGQGPAPDANTIGAYMISNFFASCATARAKAGSGLLMSTALAWPLAVGLLAAPVLAATPSTVPAVPALAASGTTQDGPAATIAREALPDWVVAREIPAMDPAMRAHVSDGMAYLVLDTQVRGNASGYDMVWRVAAQAVDRSGLEPTGQVWTEFDPRMESVTINFVHIVREGKVIDRTADVRFSVVERESDLDEGILSGNLKAIANLKDVRVGDVVDYAFTRHVRSTLWPGQYFTSLSARYSDPIALRAFRILWPSAQPLTLRVTNARMAFAERTLGDMHEWQYIGANPAYPPSEDDVPDWYPAWGRVEFSSMTDWGQLARWASALYQGDETLPADYSARLDAIGARFPDASDRLTETLRLVQDSIRYVGEEMGEGSYVPRRPSVVIARGYGDCKDKALLLAVSLRHLGIEAVPALVSSTPGLDLPARLPSPLDFDHVIVRAVLNGKVTWLDATATYQGGRGARIVPADFGYALPIRAGQAGLEKMTGHAPLAGSIAASETFTVDEKAKTALTLHVETVYTDDQADWMRANLAQRGTAAQGRQNLEFYQQSLAGITEVHPSEFHDDRDANRYTMVEDYTLSKADFDKDKLISSLSTNAYLLNGLLPKRQNTQRNDPLELPANLTRKQTIVLKALGHGPGVLEDLDQNAQGVHFTRTSTRAGDTVTMVYALTTQDRPEIPAADAEAVYAISDRVADATGIEFALDKSPLRDETATPASLMATDALAPWHKDLERAGTLMTQKDSASQIQALTIINTVADKVERPSEAAGLVDGMKGALLAQLDRRAAARTALVSSVDQYQGSPEMINLLLWLQLSDTTPEGALHTLEIARAHQPQLVQGLSLQWVQIIGQKIHALPREDRQSESDRLALALTGAGWQLAPRTRYGDAMLAGAIRANVRKGDLEAARAQLAQEPSAQSLLGLANDRRYAALWPDLEPMVADGFAKALAHDVEMARKIAEDTPNDLEAQTQYLNALRVAGRAEDAVKAGRKDAENAALVEAGGTPAFWLVNEYVSALREAGHSQEGIARMEALLKLGLEDNPNLISQAINLAGMQLSDGNFAAAYDDFHKLDATDERYTSLYGRMWIWSGEACALRALGREAEAAPLEEKLAAHAEENRSALTRNAACRADRAAIVAQLVARLDDPLLRESALAGFSDYKLSAHQGPYAMRQDTIIKEARSDPAVQAKLAEFGRAVPFAGVDTD